jgi:hypothetical protein
MLLALDIAREIARPKIRQGTGSTAGFHREGKVWGQELFK